MKAKYFLTGFLLVFTVAFSSINARAASYEMKVEEDDEYIWTLNTFDEDAMDDIWGEDWDDSDFWDDAEQGAQMKAEITGVEDGEEHPIYGDEYDWFMTEFDFWYFDEVKEDKWGDEDIEDYALYSLEDPKEYEDLFGEDAELTFGTMSFFWPTPTEDYWDDINWADYIDIDGLEVTMEFEEDDVAFGGICEEDVDAVFTFNQDGVLQNAKLLEGDDVVVEWSLGGLIPGYELPLLLGITAVFTIGLIYIINKRV